jgi:hypothetical protein
MLHPKNNRIDYGNQLIPPIGYELDRAVGTTYSLDLEALMIIPVALFYAQPLDGDPSQLRYDMLDAITKAADKITIFCQKAQIKVPSRFHYLLAYWEKGIKEIQMPSYIQSFHPKVWIIRYRHPTLPPVYRLLVTSRNLTFARDWDIAFSSEGIVGEEVLKQNLSLVDFIKSIDKRGNSNLPQNFYEDLTKVAFDKELLKFNKLSFHPIGISNSLEKLYRHPISTAKWWDEILIISPFVDNITLKTISGITGRRRYLFSKKDELDSLSPEILEFYDCFQFSKLIEDSELNEALNETDLDAQIQNLHAKFFITQSGDKIHWFIGSANCTDPAQERNIEFMVELKGTSTSGIRIKDVVNQLTNADKAEGVMLFEPYDSTKKVDQTEKKKIELEIRKIKYDLSLLSITGEANIMEQGATYDLEITIDASSLYLPKGFEVRVKPICEEQKKRVAIKAGAVNRINQFSGYTETKLSPFVEFEILFEKVCYTTFLLTMEIELPSNRLNKIFSSIINSRERFLEYLTFLLTGEETSIIQDNMEKGKGAGNTEDHAFFNQLPVYEKLLIASSRHPEKLGAVDKLIVRLKDETQNDEKKIISEEFEEFWQIFRQYHQSLQHAES